MSDEEEQDLVRRIDKIEVAVDSIAKSVAEIAKEQRDERARNRFDGGKVLTVATAVFAVLLSGASMLLSIYVEPLRVQMQANEIASQRVAEWMLETQFRLGELSSRDSDRQSPAPCTVASN